MAVIKLGALISDIAGSVGGVTFRRIPNGHLAQIKPRGYSRNRLLTNSRLSEMVAIIKSWSVLSAAQRQAWADAALLFQFPDKFGQLRNLTGRQLFIKLNANFIVLGGFNVDVSTLQSTTPFVTFDSDELVFQGVNQVFVDSDILQGFALLQVQLIPNSSVNPTFTRREIVAFIDLSVETFFDISQFLLNRYPFAGVGSKFLFYVIGMNSSGFRSAPQVGRFTVISATTTTVINFNPSLNELLTWQFSSTVTAFTLEFNMLINNLVGGAGLWGRDTIGARITSDSKLQIQNIGQFLFTTAALPFPIGALFNLKITFASSVYTVSINNSIVATFNLGGSNRLFEIGHFGSAYLNGYITNLKINSGFYPMNEGSGITASPDVGQVLTLVSNGTASDMWGVV